MDMTPVMASDPGMTTANMTFATVEVQLKEGDPEPEQHLESGEHIERILVPLNELYERILQYTKEGKVPDARLLHFAAGIHFAKNNAKKYHLG